MSTAVAGKVATSAISATTTNAAKNLIVSSATSKATSTTTASPVAITTTSGGATIRSRSRTPTSVVGRFQAALSNAIGEKKTSSSNNQSTVVGKSKPAAATNETTGARMMIFKKKSTNNAVSRPTSSLAKLSTTKVSKNSTITNNTKSNDSDTSLVLTAKEMNSTSSSTSNNILPIPIAFVDETIDEHEKQQQQREKAQLSTAVPSPVSTTITTSPPARPLSQPSKVFNICATTTTTSVTATTATTTTTNATEITTTTTSQPTCAKSNSLTITTAASAKSPSPSSIAPHSVVVAAEVPIPPTRPSKVYRQSSATVSATISIDLSTKKLLPTKEDKQIVVDEHQQQQQFTIDDNSLSENSEVLAAFNQLSLTTANLLADNDNDDKMNGKSHTLPRKLNTVNEYVDFKAISSPIVSSLVTSSLATTTSPSLTTLTSASNNQTTIIDSPKSSSFADKISRSFFDLTTGSSDRLQKWKNKLNSTTGVSSKTIKYAVNNGPIESVENAISSPKKQIIPIDVTANDHQRYNHQRTASAQDHQFDTLKFPLAIDEDEIVLVDWGGVDNKQVLLATKMTQINQQKQQSSYRNGDGNGQLHTSLSTGNIRLPSSLINSDFYQQHRQQKIIVDQRSRNNDNDLLLMLDSSNTHQMDHRTLKPTHARNTMVTTISDDAYAHREQLLLNYQNAKNLEHLSNRRDNIIYQQPPTSATIYYNNSLDDGNECQRFVTTDATSGHIRHTDDSIICRQYYNNDAMIVSSSTLPPPARITPYSGVKPKDSDIVRPIAFRPVMTVHQQQSDQSTTSTNENHNRESFNSINSSIYSNMLSVGNTVGASSKSTSCVPNVVVGNNCRPLSDLDHSLNRTNRIQTDTEHSIMPKPFVPPPTTYTASSHRPKHQTNPTTTAFMPPNNNNSYTYNSSNSTLSSASNNHYPINKRSQPTQPVDKTDPDYDIVPEYVDLMQQTFDGVIQTQQQQPPPPRSIDQNSMGGKSSGSIQSSPEQMPKFVQQQKNHQPNPSPSRSGATVAHHHQIYSANGSSSFSGSRHSSGIHVTPSPTDSTGLIDYESVLREKERELSNIRSTMEQNEEIIVRVYQEKERHWDERLRDMKTQLDRAVTNETGLKTQVQRLQEQRDQLQFTIQNLTAEKIGLQRKCLQIEREMFAIRDRLEQLVQKQNSVAVVSKCPKCSYEPSSPPSVIDDTTTTTASSSSTTTPAVTSRWRSSTVVNNIAAISPIPAPRLSKENNSKSPSPAEELRSEVDVLRSEVMNLREMLNGQITLFNDERRRWDDEKSKVLNYQQVLQSNFAQINERNRKLEQSMAKVNGVGTSIERSSSVIVSNSSGDRLI